MKTINIINDDFDMDLIADSGQCFRWEKVRDDTYRIINRSDCLYITDLGEGRYGFEYDENAATDWKEYLDLEEDYAAIRDRIDAGKDPFLHAAAADQKGIRILRQDPWEMLITFIISQNKNIPGIKRCVENLCRAGGERRTDVRGQEYYAFPDPKATVCLGEETLKSCRLGYRCAYITAAAKAVLDGLVDLDALKDAGEEETIATLTSIHGVGPKVANCISLFGLHHIDAFPRDVWVRRILEQEYPGGYPYDEYSPYNGIYQQYMFAYYRKLYA